MSFQAYLDNIKEKTGLDPSGSWNAMVTHRVRVTDPAQVDAELLGWQRIAYDQL